MVFAIHWHESAMDLHVFSIPNPPSASLPISSLWVFPVHQPKALVSCIQPGLVICFTLDSILVSKLFSQNIPPLPSPTESKSLFCISVLRKIYGISTWMRETSIIQDAHSMSFVRFTSDFQVWSGFLLYVQSWSEHFLVSQSWVFIEGTDVEAETRILWPPDVESWLIWKDPDAGKDWKQEEEGTIEDEMVGWHHRLNGHGFGWTPGVGDGQGGLACCSSWGCKESDMTEGLNWTESMKISF